MDEWMTARTQGELDKLIEQHGRALRVRVVGEWSGALCVRGRELHSLDLAGVHVRGSLDAAGARIEGELHAFEAQIDGNLDISGAQIAGDVRADEAQIAGDVRADEAQIAGLLVLDQAHVSGSVHAHGARIGGSLIFNEAHIVGAVDATGARLGGSLTYRNGLIQGGIVLPAAMHGVPGQAVAQCDGYILWLGEDGRYRAGCRGPFTREQALEHWGEHRRDERAKVFREAIEETIIEFDRIYSSW